MKLSINKKETPNEDGPVMLQLQRRHTLAEVDNNSDNTTATAHSTASRSNSVSDADTVQNNSQVTTEFQPKETATPEGNQTSLSTASTVVITESELSSSWLYKNKKAQMNMASPCDNIGESSESNVEEQPVQDKSPMITRPIKNNKGTTHKSKSSCCCYTTALCVICLATLGILAAIAAIIYIEIFSTKNGENGKTNHSDIESNFTDNREILIHDLIPMQKIGDLLDQENKTVLNDKPTSELIFPMTVEESLDSKHSYKENDNKLEINSEVAKQSEGNKRTRNETADKDEEAMPIITNKTNSLEKSISDNEKSHANRLFEVMKSNVSQILNIPHKESPYSKLFQLYNDLHNTESKNLTTLKEISNSSVHNSLKMRNLDLSVNDSDFNEQNIIKNNSEDIVQKNVFEFALKHDLGIERNEADDITSISTKSLPFHDHILEEKTKSLPHLEQDGTVEPELPVTETLQHHKLDEEDAVHVLENNSEDEHGKQDIEQLFSKSLPQSVIEVEENIVPGLENNSEQKNEKQNIKQLFSKTLPQSVIKVEEDFDSTLKNNMENEHSTDLDLHEIKSVPNQNEDLDDFKQLKDRRNDKDSQEQNSNNSTTMIKPFILNQPIVGTNVAVPGPVELFRRLMSERENSFKPRVRQDEHDRRFSLAQALESLRNLDVNNQLPSSRQKPAFKITESPKWNIPHRVLNQEVNEERSHYLENLRKILYENE